MKTLPYNKAKIEEIIKTYPTPFHIYDEKGIKDAAHKLQRAFSWNVGYKEYYAVKACANPAILKLLHDNGCGMDCSSYTELMLCEALGITGEDIMFSSNATPANEFVYARKLGAGTPGCFGRTGTDRRRRPEGREIPSGIPVLLRQ